MLGSCKAFAAKERTILLALLPRQFTLQYLPGKWRLLAASGNEISFRSWTPGPPPFYGGGSTDDTF